ncbi:diacylglycerol/lipid kinase family protein [Sphingomonas oryzagri]|uniref:Diacylglycerol kinase family protein n=1 Tax=Sphingomonas oryzagri TaxID=3042314 RepID=A0ABT6N3I2_9SPHN|nr:diacylglycerol kinase family protein [Sphingomonas oryzagri]MDH7639870.1 diacylglycerol kinase family protein [Sphingomonas oryzagri]
MAERLVEIVYNPASGGYRPSDIAALRAAFEARGARVRLSPTGHEPIVIDPAADLLCVAGGDGTVRHAALALHRAGRTLPIAIFPSGTVNLLSREIGKGHAPEALAARLLGEDRRPAFAVTLNDTLFLACASVGPEALAVAGVSAALKRRIGRFAYAAALLPHLGRWPRTPIRIDVAGRRVACEAFYVARGRYFAGRWIVSPDAALDRPEMRLVILKTARRRDMARFWMRLALHRPVADLPFVEEIACTAFTAEADRPLPVQADGDIAATLPARFALIPEPFRFA